MFNVILSHKLFYIFYEDMNFCKIFKILATL